MRVCHEIRCDDEALILLAMLARSCFALLRLEIRAAHPGKVAPFGDLLQQKWCGHVGDCDVIMASRWETICIPRLTYRHGG